MRVALCLHGYFDSRMDHTSKGSDGYNHIKKNILDKADVDVYIHNWQPELEQSIRNLYNPVQAIFEQQIDFSETVNDLGLAEMPGDSSLGRSPATILSHFYSIQKCFEQVDFDQYDCVIKSRFDLGRINRNTSGPGKQNPYPVQCINFTPSLTMDSLYIADWQYMNSDGPPDMWFYGPPKIMKHFSTLYDYLVMNMDATSVNAIHQLKGFMEDVGIWQKRIPLPTEWE
jgi:hypothetical protein